MRGFFLYMVTLLLALPSVAQQRCASTLLESNQNRQESEIEFENWLVEKQKLSSFRQSGVQQETIYRIPVVYHVIHDGSAIGFGTNISDEKLLEQINILNADFRRANSDASETPANFLGVAADTKIEFVLAKQDPEGLPTTGIIRQKGSMDSYNPRTHDVLLKSESFWDQDLYVNIYVTDLEGFLGAAQFPFSSIPGSELNNYKSTDGLLMDYLFIGNNDNTGTFDSYGRTLTHEMGHYLGLKHIWGDGGCSLDDFCADTPTADSSTSGCPVGEETCGSVNMIQNYMDYTDDVCMNLFTTCQTSRMRTVLEESPRRASLLTSPGLSDPVMVSNDLGVRSIISPDQSDCETLINPSVELRNYGTNLISSFQIALYSSNVLIEDKTITNSIEIGATAVVTFDPLTLSSVKDSITFVIGNVNQTTDGNPSNNIQSVVIHPFVNEPIPYSLTFEGSDPLSGFVENGAVSQWKKTTVTKETINNTAAYLPFYNQDANFGYQDIITTATLDLSALTSAQIDFDYAFAQNLSGATDGLIVAVSTDCGAGFPLENIIFESYGSALATSSATASEFIPLGSGDWENINLNITRFAGEEAVQIAFMGVNAGGNNIYVDDITVTSANLLPLDAGIKSVDDLPLVSCEFISRPSIEVKNFGFQTINTLTVNSLVNGIESSHYFDELSLASGRTSYFTLDISDELIVGENDILITIESINNQQDQFLDNNEWLHYGIIDTLEESIPLREDFDPLTWNIINPQGDSLFEQAELGRNKVLMSRSFDNSTIGQSMLISPVILTEDYEQGGIRFNYSYAQRLGLNDNLKVLLSINCGRTFDIELLSLNAPQLAVANSNDEWIPEETEWKQQFIDISEHMIWSKLRVAFVFTNGNGNRLYLDDIDLLTNNDPDLPEFENPVFVYPNPADGAFNVALNLQNKQTVNIRLMDMSGRVVFDKPFSNSINQTLNFQTPAQSGFYIIQVTGENSLNQIKRIFIRR